MDLQCDICGKSFNTNAGLYNHKQMMHAKPSVILVNHDRYHHDDHWKPSKRKRKPKPSFSDRYPPKKRRYEELDDELDDGLKIIDEFKDEEYKDDGLYESDEDMESIDGPPKDHTSTDDDEANLPSPSNPVRPPIASSQLNYKLLYEKCRQDYNKMKFNCKKQLHAAKRKHKADLKLNLDELNNKRDADIEALRERFSKQMNDLEQAKNIEMDDRIRIIQNEQQVTIQRMDIEHQNIITELEADCEQRIKVLKTLIKGLQDDDEESTNLFNAIFNCTTIEEIFEIDRLVKNHQLDVVARDHLKTLQNLFLSLSYGILPICDIQRKMVTPKQRELIEKIQSSSGATAKRYLKENHNEVVNLFTVIHDSLKLIRNTFNRYGTLPDA